MFDCLRLYIRDTFLYAEYISIHILLFYLPDVNVRSEQGMAMLLLL